MEAPPVRHTIFIAVVAVGGACALAGCRATGDFSCLENRDCELAGIDGVCEPSGYCSFPDDTCGSGKRYGDFAPSGIGGECVPTAHDAPDGGPDAPPGTPDAPLPPPPDAPPGTPDAAPVPDAPPPPPPDAASLPDAGTDILVTFGETGTATFSGVTADTWLDADAPAFNHGASPILAVGASPERHTVIRFDVSALPSGATVLSAEMFLWTTPDGALETGTMRVYRLLEGWSEGNKNGAAGQANYTQRTASNDWGTPGAGAPGSHPSSHIVTFAPSSHDSMYTIPLPTSMVTAWIAAPGSNFGLALEPFNAGAEAAAFVSREGTPAAKRPLLRIKYRP
jgi:hypothetical protein